MREVCTFVSKRVKTCQEHTFLTPAPVCERSASSCQNVSKKIRVKKCFATPAYQKVSKNRRGQKHEGLRVRKCQNVSKRVKKCQKACQLQCLEPAEALKSCPKPCRPRRNVSKVVNVSKKCQNSGDMTIPRVRTCQNVSKTVSVSKSVKYF